MKYCNNVTYASVLWVVTESLWTHGLFSGVADVWKYLPWLSPHPLSGCVEVAACHIGH